MAVIEIEGLRKTYRKRGGETVAIAGLDLSVPEGGVFGFLGPNGSGKTTTIRSLLGLIRPTSGTCRLLGKQTPGGLPEVLPKVGAIVETPRMFPGFSGRRNLELLGRHYGIGRESVTRVLDRVGLGDRGDDLFKNYSLGMKQRLGIGAALLKDPSVLILDEPANGLDPAGIVEVRTLLRALGDEGRTVFVSSHILNEIQQICDRVAILSRGKLVTTGSVADVISSAHAGGLLVKVGNTRRALSALRAGGFDCTLADGAILVSTPPEKAATVTKALADKQIYLTELRPHEATLESVFLELTADPPKEGT